MRTSFDRRLSMVTARVPISRHVEMDHLAGIDGVSVVVHDLAAAGAWVAGGTWR